MPAPTSISTGTRSHGLPPTNGNEHRQCREPAPPGVDENPTRVDRPASAGHPLHQEPGEEAADVGRDVVARHRPTRTPRLVTEVLLQVLRQPRPDELPAQPQHRHHDARARRSGGRTPSRGARPCRRPAAGGRSVEVAAADEREPERHPQQPGEPDRPEHHLPAAAERADEEDVQRRDHRAGTRAALEDAVAERPVLRREDLPRGDERTRPVPGLEQPEHRAATRSQRNVPVPASSPGDSSQPMTSGCAGEARGDAGQRPAGEHDRVEPSRAEAVGEETERDRPDRERVAEPPLDLPVPLVVEGCSAPSVRSRSRTGPAGPCSSETWRATARRTPTTSRSRIEACRSSGVKRPRTGRPSRRRARGRRRRPRRRRRTAPRPSPAVAAAGVPMWPGSLRSGITQAR